MQKREVDSELNHYDKEFTTKRTHVDLAFAKHVIAYRWLTKGGKEDEAKECFKVFDKRERNVVSTAEIKKEVIEQLG